jgi:hypothetical protein
VGSEELYFLQKRGSWRMVRNEVTVVEPCGRMCGGWCNPVEAKAVDGDSGHSSGEGCRGEGGKEVAVVMDEE